MAQLYGNRLPMTMSTAIDCTHCVVSRRPGLSPLQNAVAGCGCSDVLQYRIEYGLQCLLLMAIWYGCCCRVIDISSARFDINIDSVQLWWPKKSVIRSRFVRVILAQGPC